MMHDTLYHFLKNDWVLEDGFPLAALLVEPTIHIHDKAVHIQLHWDAPAQLISLDAAQHGLAMHWPDYTFTLESHTRIQAHPTQMPGHALRQVKNTIAVASGKGGVGKSTVALNLAVTLAQAGARVGILDADIYGPSLPLMLGHAEPVTAEGAVYTPVLAHGLQAMSMGYLTHNKGPLIWRGPMLAKALIQMLDITAWDNLDYLIIDLPPGTGDIALSLVQKIPLTGAIIVSTPQEMSVIDAEKALRMFIHTHIAVLGIVENMSTHTCTACGHQDALFGAGGAQALSRQYSIPFLGPLPLERFIRESADHGSPVAAQHNPARQAPWQHIARNCLAALANTSHTTSTPA